MYRAVARDIGGGDPERMTPTSVAHYVTDLFCASAVKVQVLDNVNKFEKEYPLYAAVNRAANAIERHRGGLILHLLSLNPHY